MADKFHGRNFLVVEDEMLLFLLIEELLVQHGCASVKIASSLPKALELICSHAFDAATVDLNLNGVKSFPVADALLARGIPFIFTTGYSGALLQGPYSKHPLVRKPFQEPALIASLHHVLSV